MERKREQIKAWLEANPNKTERDWLLEVRCSDDDQRKKLVEIIDACDANSVAYSIGYGIAYFGTLLINPLWVKNLGQYPYDVVVDFDLAIQKPDDVIFLFDMDAPDSIFDGYNPKRPWENVWNFLNWKGADSEEAMYASAVSSLYKEGRLYFHDCFIDWKNPDFLNYIKKPNR